MDETVWTRSPYKQKRWVHRDNDTSVEEQCRQLYEKLNDTFDPIKKQQYRREIDRLLRSHVA